MLPIGLIPAHAGKTANRIDNNVGMRAHPRSRGENCSFNCFIYRKEGSSPLTRGKLVSSGGARAGPRLIPAHAGKTSRTRAPITFMAAHPRSRGENPEPASRVPRAAGSSPLTRGKPTSEKAESLGDRLIPAHAGKTRSSPTPPQGTAAHPRSRGENVGLQLVGDELAGSSPLTRGKPRAACCLGQIGRLIPAHAGKTGAARLGLVRAWAHPRSRGENRLGARRMTRSQGSSPLTRGKLGHAR